MTIQLYPTLTPGADETPTSFASRLARLHDCNHLRGFCTDLGLPFQGIADGDRSAICMLAKLAGADPSALLSNAFVRDGREHCLRGEKLSMSATAQTRMRLCPQCVADDITAAGAAPELAVYDRYYWKLTSIRTCAIHNLALVDLGVVDKTNTVHDFASFIAGAIDRLAALPRVERKSSALETYILDRLDGEPKQQGLLDALELHAAIKMCEIIGAIALNDRDVALAKLSDDQWQGAGGTGFDIASKGENAIRAFLSSLQQSFDYQRAATEGPQAVFGQLYKWLAFSAEDACFDPLRDLLRRHIIETMPVGPGDVIFDQPVERRVLHSVYTASVAFGTHRKRLRKILAAKGLLPADHADKADNHVLVDAEAAQALHDDGVFDGLTLKDLESYTGAGRVQAKLLVTSGFLVPAVASGDVSETRTGWVSIPKKQVDAFLAHLQQDAVSVDAAGDGQYDIPAAAKRANCSAAEIIRMILARELEWVGRLASDNPFFSILVEVAEIKAKTRLPDLDGLTAHEFGKTMHYSWPVVRALIDNGVLRQEKRINPINRCPVMIVPTAEVERFKQTYISLTELAEERRLHATMAKRFLDDEGIKPALGPAIFHATFYKRSQL